MVDKGLLIELVRERVSLWDQREKHYHNRDMRAKLWDEVGKELGIEGDVARKTWDLLRDMLRKKIKDNTGASGAAAKAKWVYFDSLSFLLPMMKPRVTSGNLPMSEVAMGEEAGETPQSEISPPRIVEFDIPTELDENVEETDELQSRQSTSLATPTASEGSRMFHRPGSKRRSQSVQNEALDLERRKVQLLENRFGTVQPTCSTEDDEDLSFFKSLIPSIKKLPLLRRMKLRSTILNSVINELEAAQSSQLTNRPWPSTPTASREPPPHHYPGQNTYHQQHSYSSDTSSPIPSPYQQQNTGTAEPGHFSNTYDNF